LKEKDHRQGAKKPRTEKGWLVALLGALGVLAVDILPGY
jgi:hypothetical protein